MLCHADTDTANNQTLQIINLLTSSGDNMLISSQAVLSETAKPDVWQGNIRTPFLQPLNRLNLGLQSRIRNFKANRFTTGPRRWDYGKCETEQWKTSMVWLATHLVHAVTQGWLGVHCVLATWTLGRYGPLPSYVVDQPTKLPQSCTHHTAICTNTSYYTFLTYFTYSTLIISTHKNYKTRNTAHPEGYGCHTHLPLEHTRP